MTEALRDRIVSIIRDYIATHGVSPSIRDIQDAVKINSSGYVHEALRKLRDEGKVTWIEGKQRTLRLLLDNDAERLRVAVRVLEREQDGSFKRLMIGGKCYALESVR